MPLLFITLHFYILLFDKNNKITRSSLSFMKIRNMPILKLSFIVKVYWSRGSLVANPLTETWGVGKFTQISSLCLCVIGPNFIITIYGIVTKKMKNLANSPGECKPKISTTNILESLYSTIINLFAKIDI